MFKVRLNLPVYYSPDDNNTGTIEGGKLSVSDMAEFLGKEDDPIELDETLSEDEKADEEEPEEKPEKKDDSEKSLEDELDEELEDEKPKTNDDEVVMPVRRKEVLAKYPNIFKDFPHLDKAVYREQKYSEIVPTLRDAQIAVDKAETLDRFSADLEQGATTTILQAVKEEDPEAFNMLVDNYLDNLKSVDEGAYFHILGNIAKQFVIAMHNSKSEDDKTAAALLYKFVFNSETFEAPKKLSQNSGKEKDEREAKIEEREQNFRKTQLDTHVNQVNTRLDNVITSTIDKNIDPRGSMNGWQRERATDECKNQLEKAIKSDTRFQGILDKLWEKAAESNFSQESLDRITSAYKSKAKGILPDVIRKVRNNALKGLGNKSPNERNNPLPVGRAATGKRETNMPRSSGSSDRDKAKAIPKGTKSIDFLMKD